MMLRVALFRCFETELRAWYGLLPLWQVFWGYGVIASAVLIGLYAMAAFNRQIAVQQALLIVFAVYTVWILVAVWRCAEASEPHGRLIVRSLTIAWAVNAIMVVTFLQMDLLTSYISTPREWANPA